METNLVMEALKFMVLGMGIVYAFLIIMIFALKAQAVLIGRFFPENDNIVVVKKAHPNVTQTDTTKKIAAITAAIQHHNNQKG